MFLWGSPDYFQLCLTYQEADILLLHPCLWQQSQLLLTRDLGVLKSVKYILHNLKKVSSCVCGDLGISMPCLWQQNWILVTSEHAMFLRRSWDNFHLCLWCPKKRIQGKTLSFSNSNQVFVLPKVSQSMSKVLSQREIEN